MTTLVVVQKGKQVAMASDSLVTFGDTRLSSNYEANEKMFKVGDSLVGLAGSTAHFPVMKKLLTTMPDCNLHSREAVFETFLSVHAILKEKFFLNTKEEDSDPYESSQITTLIANASGIYGVYSYREVFRFERFWGIGSGRNFALGAMSAMYDQLDNAKAIAKVGVEAGIEFDKNSAGPVRVNVINMNDSTAARTATKSAAKSAVKASVAKVASKE